MRIQHNIMAMNAYRNYNNNTSALSKNLEKLSSGYKINRAGDDAAGLAISEKMRAQITGLNAAQKNVKDGVSLVKTAEGAMQEIQDMLNRMDYLATQSANGTYDDPVDRLNLQKEVKALQTEIDRIADSANFNGIKLLDGSLDASTTTKTEVSGGVVTDGSKLILQDWSKDNLDVGSKTILKDAPVTKTQTEFTVDLQDTKVSGAADGDTLDVTIGNQTIKFTVDSTKAADGWDTTDYSTYYIKNAADLKDTGKMATAIAAAFNGMKADPDGDGTFDDANLIGGEKFTATATNGTVNFKQDAASTATVDPDLKVKVEYTSVAGAATKATATQSAALADIQASAATKATYVSDDKLETASTTAGTDITAANGFKVTFSNKNYDIAGATDKAGQAAEWAKAYNADAGNTAWKAEAQADGSIKLIANTKGTGVTDETGANITGTDGTDFDFTAAADADSYATITIDAPATASTTVADNDVSTTKVTIDGKSYDVAAYNKSAEDQLNAWVAAYNADAANTAYTAAAQADGTVKLESQSAAGTSTTAPAGMTGGTYKDAAAAGATKTLTLGGYTANVTSNTDLETALNDFVTAYNADAANDEWEVAVNAANNGVVFTAKEAGAIATTGATAPTGATLTDGTDADADAVTGKLTGTYNVSTTQNVTGVGDDAGRLASTILKLDDKTVVDGTTLTIGKDSYVFKTKADDSVVKEGETAGKDANGATIIDVSGEAAADQAKKAMEILGSKPISGANEIFDLGYDATKGELSIHEKAPGTTDEEIAKKLTTLDGFNSLVTTKTAETKTTTTTANREGGKALTLQIGDTSDEFNQMGVSIGDMHVKAMGAGTLNAGTDDEKVITKTIADIDISTQTGAHEAVDIIKNAINYVSGVRGDLGAIQNRLEHTQNNLSVMAENIQDAESTIRDTDVAEEMMSYVKNNILVQSAQAMLAQANQVPQGVLQLLG